MLRTWLAFLISISLLSACKKDLDLNKFDDYRPNAEYGAPLFISTLKIDNLVKQDTVNIGTDPDGLIRFKFYEDSIFGFALGDYLTIPPQSPSIISSSLGLLPIPISTTADLRTLDELEDQFTVANKNAINGVANTTAIFPAITDANATPIALPTHTEFTSVQLTSGFVVVTIHNTLPVNVSNITLSINTLNPAQVILGSINFTNIGANATVKDSFPFFNKTVNANWSYSISSISLASSSPNQVFVDMTKGLDMSFSLSSSLGISGQSKFPSASFDGTSAYIFISGSDPNQRLRKVEFASGKIKFIANSSIRENIEIVMNFPGSTRNGNPVPPQIITIPYTGIGIHQGFVDIANIRFDLTQKPGQDYSNIYYTYSARLAGSNTILPFDSSNKFNLQLFTDETTLEYAEGFFGSKTLFHDSLEIDLDFLRDISSGLSLDNPTIKFHTRNSLGVPIELDLGLKARNDNGAEQPLNLAPFEIAFPTIAQVGQTIKGIQVVDKNNSDLDKFISLPPHTLNFNIKAVGEKGYPNTSNHFIQKNGIAVVGIEMDLPLQIRADSFTLIEFVDVDFDGELGIENGTMFVKAENGFPFDAELELFFLNGVGDTLNTIKPGKVLVAGPVDANGRVNKPGNSLAAIELNAGNLDALTKSRTVAIKAVMTSTNGGNTTVGIYSDYKLKLGISVKVKPKFGE